jgi:hypothetical protein
MLDQIPPELRDAGPGIAGSFIALFFLRRPLFIAAGLFVGGCVVSYYGAVPVADYFDIDGNQRAVALVGLLLGCFSMATFAKVYDTIEAIEPVKLWQAVLQFIRKRLGLEVKE